MVPIQVVVFSRIEQQMLNQRLAIDAFSCGAGPRDRFMRLAATRMHDIERRAGHVGDHDGAVGRLGLHFGRARIGMAVQAGDAARQQCFLHRRDDVAVLGVHQRDSAKMGAARERVVKFVVVHHQRALVGHEMLEGVDAVGFDDGLHLVEDLLRPGRHRHVEAVVAGRFLRFVPPVLIARASTARDREGRNRPPS
jgi:hypothetical protein